MKSLHIFLLSPVNQGANNNANNNLKELLNYVDDNIFTHLNTFAIYASKKGESK